VGFINVHVGTNIATQPTQVRPYYNVSKKNDPLYYCL